MYRDEEDSYRVESVVRNVDRKQREATTTVYATARRDGRDVTEKHVAWDAEKRANALEFAQKAWENLLTNHSLCVLEYLIEQAGDLLEGGELIYDMSTRLASLTSPYRIRPGVASATLVHKMMKDAGLWNMDSYAFISQEQIQVAINIARWESQVSSMLDTLGEWRRDAEHLEAKRVAKVNLYSGVR